MIADSHRPEILDVLLMVADSAWQSKDYAASKRAAELALSLDENNVRALTRLGRIALAERDPKAAFARFLEAAFLEPGAAAATNVSVALARIRHWSAAAHSADIAVRRDPAFVPAHIQRAGIEEEQGHWQAAEALAAQSLERFPVNHDLRYLLAVCQLAQGNWDAGWINYESRQPRLDLAAKLDEYPEWQGEPLAGKTILVCGEQGAGDQIMFARWLTALQLAEASVVLFTRPDLARLFAVSFPGVRILASDRELAGLEPDYWTGIGSLALRFGGIRDCAGYLTPALADIERFAALFPRDGRLRVGLCWRGNPRHRRDAARSMDFAELNPLLDAPGVAFYSLQAGGGRESGLPDLVAHCHDFADTAAAIANLDLTISVDTAVLHLAGALGKPAWGLIGHPPEWRWAQSQRWYPRLTLWHREPDETWAGVIGRARCRLVGVHCEPESHEVPAAPINPVVAARECRYGLMAWHRNDTYIGRALDLYGEYSEGEADLFRRILKPGDDVVEAGANIGALSVALARIVGPQGKVLAFEPQPAYCELLRHNAQDSCIVACNEALGAEEGEITLRRVPLDVVHAPGWEATGESFQATLATIDSYALPRCHLIKIDVDGEELNILKGAAETIARCRPFLFVEYDKPERYPDLLEWMRAQGYRLYQHDAPLYNPQNFAGNRVNVFGSMVSRMILGVPEERKKIHPVDWGLQRIREESA